MAKIHAILKSLLAFHFACVTDYMSSDKNTHIKV